MAVALRTGLETERPVGRGCRRDGTSGLLTGRHRIVHVAPAPAELGFEHVHGSLHVELAGELCAQTVALLQRPLLDLVELSDARRLTVDLAGVSFIDARAISMLLTVRSCLAARGATMQVTASSRHVDRIIALCALDEVFACSSASTC